MEITLGGCAELPLNKPLLACSADFHRVLSAGLLPEKRSKLQSFKTLRLPSTEPRHHV